MARRVLGFAMLAWLLAAAPAAQAAFHMFRIQQVFTNADGTVQFVVLRECCGVDGENLLNGVALRSTSGGVTRTFTFPRNLPSSETAGHNVLIATQGFANLGIVTPDYVIPDGFVPVGGGTLSYAGVSQLTFGPLPTDGRMLITGGQTVPNVATNFAGQSASVGAAPPSALAVEFYNAGLDHYFLSHVAAEIADLDNGVHPGWARTGQSFRVFASASAQNSPVCRFYIPPAKGDSHFYGRGTQECTETGSKNPTFVNEDPQFFFVVLPAAGVCPAGTINVYRAFDNRADANHRYMVDPAIRDLMESQRHWVIEGDGPDRVVMCVPPSS
ncbi:MAG: hypothetical protein U1F54_17390 [Burkholderiales bacterium]